ncbi:AAA family ATPase [Natronosalvus amylolyticus]|uniref:AAA family ATPase n=1 Tax=Natronosalvus amylolyticus TaxID=2961994 RepID=UPI0020C9922E|nr:AAA family ATPase [Natronosalvus amylolyticus]
MSTQRAREERFIEECHAHNPWWEGDVERLQHASAWHPRSDLYAVLNQIEKARDASDLFDRVFGWYGQTGIGKSTLLLQLIGTIVDAPSESVGLEIDRREYEIVDAFDPTDVLYIPIERSLYHLERAEEAIDTLGRVVEYFETRITTGSDRLILLDDLGVLESKPGRLAETIYQMVDEQTYVICTGSVREHVSLETETERLLTNPVPLLPVKFVDFAQMRLGDEQATRLERLQAGESTAARDDPDTLTLQDIRRPLRDDADPVSFAKTFDRLYFDVLDKDDRQSIAQEAREFLRHGGFPRQLTVGHSSTTAGETTNELARSHLELYLFKELARAKSIDRPENLQQLCSLAALPGTNEYGYRELAGRLDVDRRTVRNYIQVLEEGIVLTESTNYALRRHRKTRLYLRDPRHVVLLSQRHAHDGFESVEGRFPYNPSFERILCRTVVFDHAMRLAYNTGLEPSIEFAETEHGVIEYILRQNSTVLPFALGYEPRAGDATEAVTTFDPATGNHESVSGSYDAPVRFVITDAVPRGRQSEGTLQTTVDETTVCYVPFWAFLLIC